MIGRDITEKRTRARWRIVGADHGQFVIAPVDRHGAPATITAAVLASRFGVEDADAPTVDDVTGWRALADAAEESARGPAEGVDPGPSPEDVFAAHAAAPE